jgi:hypothetical protein
MRNESQSDEETADPDSGRDTRQEVQRPASSQLSGMLASHNMFQFIPSCCRVLLINAELLR